MELTIKKQIGKNEYIFTVSGNDLYEVLSAAEKVSFENIAACKLCGSDHLYLRAYQTKEHYKYVKVICAACHASVTFGQRREDPTVYYLRKNEKGEPDWQKGQPKTDQVKSAIGDDEFFESCKELAKKDQEQYQKNLKLVGNYKTAREIPPEKRSVFLGLFSQELPF